MTDQPAAQGWEHLRPPSNQTQPPKPMTTPERAANLRDYAANLGELTEPTTVDGAIAELETIRDVQATLNERAADLRCFIRAKLFRALSPAGVDLPDNGRDPLTL